MPMTADPSVAVSRLSDAALKAAHDEVHHLKRVQAAVGSPEIEAHHLIAEELRKRGLPHPADDDGVHNAVVTMSRVRVPLATLTKMLGPVEVQTIAEMAVANGTSFADVYELLTANGWMLRAEPAAPSDDMPEVPAEAPEPEDLLQPRQTALYEGYEQIVEQFGKFDQSSGPNGAHYIADNPFVAEGLACANCVFYEGGQGCELVSGQIAPDAICKLWVIDASLLKMRAHQPRARSGEFVDTATAGVGMVAPSQTGAAAVEAAGTVCSCDVPVKAADGQCDECGGFVLPASKREKAAGSFNPPQGVQDEAQRALDWIAEGHAGSGFTDVGRARARDLASGRAVSEDTLRRMVSYFARHEVDKQGEGWSPGENGYPSAGRVAWAAWGGDPGRSWANGILRSVDAEKSLIVKQVDERRFTLGPWYVPNMLDAHGEWTDDSELQSALWDYVRKGNREIRLQHTPDTKAGEWVEALTWPFPVEVPMTSPESGAVTRKRFPAGTVFLGVQWEPWAWEMVKRGEIRGYSIGGAAERLAQDPVIYADVPA